jgi:hypothetical protein
MIKWWNSVFFHVLNLAVVSAHILYTKTNRNKIPLEMFNEKIAGRLIASAGTEIQIHGRTSSPAGKSIGRDHFYTEFQQHMLNWRENLSGHVVCAQRSKHQTGKTVKKCTTTYC